MKTSSIFAVLLVLPALSRAEAPPVPPATDSAAPRTERPARRARLLEQYDTDKDGHLSESERQAAGNHLKAKGQVLRDRVREQFDADKDGKLSDTERQTAKATLQEKGSALRTRALEQFDANKDGQLSEEERATLKAAVHSLQQKRRAAGAGGDGRREAKAAARQQHLLEQFDTDKDGQLSEAERAKAREARHQAAATP